MTFCGIGFLAGAGERGNEEPGFFFAIRLGWIWGRTPPDGIVTLCKSWNKKKQKKKKAFFKQISSTINFQSL